jgi:ABC-type sugar transport system ATPase subunit
LVDGSGSDGTEPTGPTGAAPVLAMRGISKRFGATRALDAVTLDLRRGEVHALVGENGAGKSTLIKVMTGVHPPDDGEILVEGAGVAARRRSERTMSTVRYSARSADGSLRASRRVHQ